MTNPDLRTAKAIRQYLSRCLDRVLNARSPTVANFPGSSWNVLRRIAKSASEKNWTAFLVGGAIRDLALGSSRSSPRDFDLVVCGISQDELAHQFKDLSPARRTSYGGLRYICDGVLVDIWPLEDTFAVRHKKDVRIQDVPKHAFLNVEAVAIELSLGRGTSRLMVESGFTQAVVCRTLEINHASNPFPEVCVVKALRTAINLDLYIGRGLRNYILKRRWDLNALVEAQKVHYGNVALDKSRLETILEILGRWDQKKDRLTINSEILSRKHSSDVRFYIDSAAKRRDYLGTDNRTDFYESRSPKKSRRLPRSSASI